MDQDFGKREARLAVRTLDRTACFEHFESDGAGAIVLCCHSMEACYYVFVAAFGEKIFGSFFEADDCDSGNAHDEDNSSGGVLDGSSV